MGMVEEASSEERAGRSEAEAGERRSEISDQASHRLSVIGDWSFE